MTVERGVRNSGQTILSEGRQTARGQTRLPLLALPLRPSEYGYSPVSDRKRWQLRELNLDSMFRRRKRKLLSINKENLRIHARINSQRSNYRQG